MVFEGLAKLAAMQKYRFPFDADCLKRIQVGEHIAARRLLPRAYRAERFDQIVHTLSGAHGDQVPLFNQLVLHNAFGMC